MKLKLFLILYTFFSHTYICTHAQTIEQNPKREFRGVWIANVMNLDFPTSTKLTPAQQQREFCAILDAHQKSKLNAVIVQIRPAADALYFSQNELWSEWLTGKQGVMPQPFYDPLAFMIDETHKRGMEFHAWLNPYRAMADTGKVKNLHENHITKLKPTWFVDYGRNRIFDPAIPEVREYINEVVADIVRRYDVDAIHFDDYFYPYPIPNQEFNDQKSFEKYGIAFQKTANGKADWRRTNINLLIEKVSNTIRGIKPYVKFGISPFPVWRNKAQDTNGSATTGGLTSYDNLFGDVRLWLSKGWIDYVAPQNYFTANFDKVPYKVLTTWWSKNTFGKHLYIGHAVYKLNGKEDARWTDKSEILEQVRFNRQQTDLHGSAYFSSKYLTTNFENFQDSLQNSLNTNFALVPPMLWKDNTPPNSPTNLEVFSAKNGILLHWQNPILTNSKNEKPTYYVIYRFENNEIIDIANSKNIIAIHRKNENFFVDTNLKGNGTYHYVVTSADRLHNESMASEKATIIYKDKGTWADFLLTFVKIAEKINK